MWFLRPFALNWRMNNEALVGVRLVIFLSNRLDTTLVSKASSGYMRSLNSSIKLDITLLISNVQESEEFCGGTLEVAWA